MEITFQCVKTQKKVYLNQFQSTKKKKPEWFKKLPMHVETPMVILLKP